MKEEPVCSTTEYWFYLPTPMAMAFLFKILIQMHPLSIDRAIWIYAVVFLSGTPYLLSQTFKPIDLQHGEAPQLCPDCNQWYQVQMKLFVTLYNMVRVLNVAEKNDAAKTLSEIMSNGRYRRVCCIS